MKVSLVAFFIVLLQILSCKASCTDDLLFDFAGLGILKDAFELGRDLGLCVQELVSEIRPSCVNCPAGGSSKDILECLSQCFPNPHPPACDAALSDLGKILVDLVTKGLIKDIKKLFHITGSFMDCTLKVCESEIACASPTPPTTTSTSSTTSSCSSTIQPTITCSPGSIQPTVVPCSCCFQNLCNQHPIQCGCLCSCTS